jgi:hypothetical protein
LAGAQGSAAGKAPEKQSPPFIQVRHHPESTQAANDSFGPHKNKVFSETKAYQSKRLKAMEKARNRTLGCGHFAAALAVCSLNRHWFSFGLAGMQLVV